MLYYDGQSNQMARRHPPTVSVPRNPNQKYISNSLPNRNFDVANNSFAVKSNDGERKGEGEKKHRDRRERWEMTRGGRQNVESLF